MENTRWLAEYSHQHGRPFGISACLMTVNWQELPELMAVADDLGAVLYFNTVWEPEHLSLAYADPTLILKVIEQYGVYAAERKLGGAQETAETLTSANLAGYILLLGTWYQAAVRRESEAAVERSRALV